MAVKQRYVYYAYPSAPMTNGQPGPFQHGVMDTKSGRPAATLDTKPIAEIVAKYMSEADQRATKDYAPYIAAIDGLARVMVHTMIVQGPDAVVSNPGMPDTTQGIPPPPGVV